MAKGNKEYTDTKKIEEKALNFLKTFIEDSDRISQYIADNDKEPCWDGHIYLYSNKHHVKENLLGRVPVQVKGTEVARFQTKKWKYKLEKVDLKSYLHEPTFFIVCQVKKDSKERMLFYRELLPATVQTLLRDMGDNETRKTLFHPMTTDLHEFEDQLFVFMGNSKKMISFADKKPVSFDDVLKKGVKDYSFIAPVQTTDRIKLLKYLSTHETYLYAKVSKDFDIELPISEGPARFSFMKEENGVVKVGDKVFFNGYRNEIKDGRIIIHIGESLTINFPMDSEDKIKPIVKMHLSSRFLKDAIQEAEFLLSMNEHGVLTVGDVDINIKVNEKNRIDELKHRLEGWKELKLVLDKLHVTKDLDLTSISKDQDRLIDILIATVGKNETITIPNQQSTLLLYEIGNLKLLLWCAANPDGLCSIGDYFDKTISVSYKYNGKDNAIVSPFSYLQNENYWGLIDNICYPDILPSAIHSAKQNEYCYEMLNYDVLSMIKAADALAQSDEEKCKRLLSEAFNLNNWLLSNDPMKDRYPIHVCNKLQLLKRQRELTDIEKKELTDLLVVKDLPDSIKCGIYLLLDEQDKFIMVWEKLKEDEQKEMLKFPIMKFYHGVNLD